MRTIRKFRSKGGVAGMTLIEVVMAAGLLAIVMTAIIAGYNAIFKQQRRLRNLTAEDRLVSGLVESIRSNLSLYQVSNTQADAVDPNDPGGSLYVDTILQTLPMAYSN